MEGSETELDKTIIEAIKDPLTHLVRNAVDHGIETPGTAAGRGQAARRARLSLRAFHEGGQVNIEITDDGAGIDIERVKRKAVERGAGHARPGRPHVATAKLLNLIFLPGLLHGREGHQRLRARRRHGRGEDQHREDRRHGRCAKQRRRRAPRSRSRFR